MADFHYTYYSQSYLFKKLNKDDKNTIGIYF